MIVAVCLTLRVHRHSELIERDDGDVMRNKSDQVSEWLCAKMYLIVPVSSNSLIWNWRGLKIYEDIPSGNSASSFQNFLTGKVLLCLSIQSLQFPANPQAAWWLLNKTHYDQASAADYSFNNWPNRQSDWTTCSRVSDHICFEPRHYRI
jgi:hypothetical protein